MSTCQQADSDDPTSSSENESLFSEDDDSKPISRLVSQARAPSPIRSEPEINLDLRTPSSSRDGKSSRKLDKARDAIHWSFAYIAEITGGAKLGIPPWAGLLQALINVRLLAEDPKVRGEDNLTRLIGIILSLVQRRILPLAHDRSYGRSLSRSEAKSRTRLRKLWPTLLPLLEELRVSHDQSDDLHDLSAELLARIALCALDYGHAVLNLDKGVAHRASLPDRQPLSTSHLLRCFTRFDISPGDVKSISISNSDLDVCPTWVFGVPPGALPFPNLEYLDASQNKRLSSLPIRAGLYPTLKVVTTGTDLVTSHIPVLPASDDLLEIHHGSWRRKSASLLQACITVLLESDVDPKLSSHLSDHLETLLKQSYLCEICHSACLPATHAWRDISSFGHRKPVGSERSLKLRGRICNTCTTSSRSILEEPNCC